MNAFMKKVHETNTSAKTVSLFWLGQAGFLLKLPNGKTIGIDPYLSEYVWHSIPQEGLGYKRLMPPPCTPEELAPDYLLISHEHEDHYDVDSFPGLVSNPNTHVFTNVVTAGKIRESGFDMERVTVLKKGVPVTLDGFTLIPVDCDHGSLAAEALGFILDFQDFKVYFSGDTSLTEDRLQMALSAKPEVAILPINGAYGNLNGPEAARYAGMLGSRILIPCHFWTFAKHRGDPQSLIEAMPDQAPECKLELLCQCEGITLGNF